MDALKIIKNGLVYENPTFVQCIGLCPTLAISSSAINGLGMGVAATAVLFGSNIAISAIRKIVPDEIRIPIFIVVIAGFVTVVKMLMDAFAPASLNASLGIFIPLIVVNCIILARAEAFASKNGVIASALDAVGMGMGFTLALTVIGSLRELLGNGSIFGTAVFPEGYQPALLVILNPGGFITLGILMALLRWSKQRRLERRGMAEAAEDRGSCAGCPVCGACGFGKTKKEA